TAVHDCLFLVRTERESVVDGANRGRHLGVATDDADPDLRGRDDLDVDPGFGKRAEEGRGYAWVGPHSRAYERHLADVLVVDDALETYCAAGLLKRAESSRAVGLRQRERDVGEARRGCGRI